MMSETRDHRHIGIKPLVARCNGVARANQALRVERTMLYDLRIEQAVTMAIIGYAVEDLERALAAGDAQQLEESVRRLCGNYHERKHCGDLP